MFRFANPYYLYLLLIIPIMVVIYLLYIYGHKKRMETLGEYPLIEKLTNDLSYKRKHIKFTLLLVCLTLIILILARPQFGTKSNSEEKTGIEIVIATDVSNSMLCQDVYPSRLEKAKMILSKLIDRFENDRIGLVAFAGSATTLLPITSDYVSAKIFLDQMTPETINTQGTNLAEGIRCAISSFSTRKDIGKALILITDAEDHEDGSIEIAQTANDLGINVYVLSVGTPSGGRIILPNGEIKTDNHGEEVITKLNEEIGQEIADAGKGVYINIDNSMNAESKLKSEISNLKRATYDTNSFTESNEQFIVLAIILLILVILESIITEKKNSLLKKLHFLK